LKRKQTTPIAITLVHLPSNPQLRKSYPYRKAGVILPHLAEGQATVSVARLFHVKHFRLTAR
jgi:hypothetical protein